MKRKNIKQIAIVLCLVLLMIVVPVIKMSVNGQNSGGTDGGNTEQGEETVAQDAQTPITSMEQVPALDVATDGGQELTEEAASQRIVILYKDAQADNIAKTGLKAGEVAAGSAVSDQVDVITLTDPSQIDAVIESLKGRDGIAAVDRDTVITASALPNDTYIDNQYAYKAIGADETWDKVTNDTVVKVAVVDTGVNASHEDLSGRIEESGYDFINNTTSTVDTAGHGTEVAGCVAATTNNALGIAGTAGIANVKVVPFRVMQDNNNGSLSLLEAALLKIANRTDIQVVNISLGTDPTQYSSPQPSPETLTTAINKVTASGKVVVAAAGNKRTSNPSYPAACDGVISVSATDDNNMFADDFSNYGSAIDLSAPGVNICTTNKNGGYTSLKNITDNLSGTSFSSPITAGAFAVLFAADPTLTADKAISTMESTALDLGSSGRDDYYGNGLVQLDVALATLETASSVSVKYQTHVQNVGWQNYVSDGTMSGTSGKALRLEGIHISISGDDALGVTYRTHVQDYGWQNYVSNGALSGTTGEAKRLEAIQIDLTGADAANYDIYYQVHIQDYGWLDWAKNGEAAGSEGLGKRLEGIRIQLVAKGGAAPGSTDTPFESAYTIGSVRYNTHVQNVGWQDYVSDEAMSGTSGQSLRLEGIHISLSPNLYTPGVTGSIEYRTHIQNIGWESSYVSDGAMSGTSGRALRLEAIQIRLTEDMADLYDVYYRVHAQNVGWMGWAKNDERAGTAGFAYRLEGIKIVLVPKGGAAPDSDTNTAAFIQNQ